MGKKATDEAYLFNASKHKPKKSRTTDWMLHEMRQEADNIERDGNSAGANAIRVIASKMERRLVMSL